MWRVMTRMSEGARRKKEIDMLLDVPGRSRDKDLRGSRCGGLAIQGLIRAFRPDIERLDQ